MKLTYADNPEEILEKLLEHHDIKTLKKILNSKVRKKEPRANNYFTIAVDVYILQHQNESKLEWAIDQVAERRNISDKTIKNHLTKFRKDMKERISKLEEHTNYKEKDVSIFITNFINRIINEWTDNNHNFMIIEKPYSVYTSTLERYIEEMNRYIPENVDFPF